MKAKGKTKIQFVVDPSLISKDQSEFLVRVLQEEKIKYATNIQDLDDFTPGLFFVEKKNLRKVSRFKNKMIVLPAQDQSDGLSVSKINFNSYEEISHFIDKFFLAERHLQIQERIKESERLYDIIKTYLDEINIEANGAESKKIFESILDLEMLLLQEESLLSWNTHFKSFLKKSNELQSLALVTSSGLSQEDLQVDENSLIFKLPSEDYYLFMRFKHFDVKKDAEFVELLLSTCMRTLQILDQKLVTVSYTHLTLPTKASV